MRPVAWSDAAIVCSHCEFRPCVILAVGQDLRSTLILSLHPAPDSAPRSPRLRVKTQPADMPDRLYRRGGSALVGCAAGGSAPVRSSESSWLRVNTMAPASRTRWNSSSLRRWRPVSIHHHMATMQSLTRCSLAAPRCLHIFARFTQALHLRRVRRSGVLESSERPFSTLWTQHGRGCTTAAQRLGDEAMMRSHSNVFVQCCQMTCCGLT